MEKRKVIALAFSDTHWANWKQFNKNGERLEVNQTILNTLIQESNKLRVPILFCGDFVDHPKHVDNIVLERISKVLRDAHDELDILGINGNHDLYRINSFAHPSEGYLHHFQNLTEGKIHCIDFFGASFKDFKVHGIPYIHGEVDFIEALKDRIKDKANNKPNILLLHRDLAGAVEPNGMSISKDSSKDKVLKKLLKEFDLVMSGHIHKPQPLPLLGKHVYMLGATHQQRRSDSGCEMGYWKVYSDMKIKFVPLDTPQFKYYTDEPENDRDFWIKLPDKKVVTQSQSGEDYSINITKKKLVKQYLIAKGTKSKSKLKTALKYL